MNHLDNEETLLQSITLLCVLIQTILCVTAYMFHISNGMMHYNTFIAVDRVINSSKPFADYNHTIRTKNVS